MAFWDSDILPTDSATIPRVSFWDSDSAILPVDDAILSTDAARESGAVMFSRPTLRTTSIPAPMSNVIHDVSGPAGPAKIG